MANYEFDYTIIGAGSAGISAANVAHGLGKKVALVEKRKIGGDCTWFGCVPSKALLKAAKVAHQTRELCHYGLKPADGRGEIEIDGRQVMQHVRNIVQKVYEGEQPAHFEAMGIRVFFGDTEFVDRHHLRVGSRTISSNKFLIATGSSPFVPPISGLEEIDYLTNETLFYIDELPRSLIVLGGGPIGIEMASALNRLGVKVTVVEMLDRILVREDPELTEILRQELDKEGLKILTSTRATEFCRNGALVKVNLETQDGGSQTLTADAVLIAVGRRPNISGLGLEKVGVEYSANGIKVDNTLKTSAGNIYAAGDVASLYQFSHAAEYQATVATMNALLPIPIKKKVNYEHMVWATFTDPELARGGLTEQEARERFGDSIRVYRHEFGNVDRAKTDVSEIGLGKFVTDRKGKLLGIHILGNRASELLHEAQLVKTLGLPFSKIHSMIHIYPSYGDVLKRPATHAYVDRIQNNFFVKLIGKFRKFSKS